MSTLNHVINTIFEAKYAIPREKQFWDFVDRVDWLSDTNPDRIKRMLMKTANQSTLDDLEDAYGDVYSPLHNYLEDKVSGVSDDSFHYLNTHIIGSGKKVYDAVMKDAQVAQDMIDSHSYEEGFGYIWPDSYDFKQTRREYWIKYADEVLVELKVVTRHANNKFVQDLIRRAKLVKQDKHEEALRGIDVKEITSQWRKNALTPCGKPCRDMHYMVSNFFIDIKNFIVDY